MSLLQKWCDLSDYEVEDRVNDSIHFSYFCDLNINQTAPYHTTLSRFRTILSKVGFLVILNSKFNVFLTKQTDLIVLRVSENYRLKLKLKTGYRLTI